MDKENLLDEAMLNNIGTAIVSAYKACDELMQSNNILANFLPGIDQRSRLISPFVEHAISLVDGLYYESKPNAARNCWHTRFYKDEWVFTAHFLGRGKRRKLPNKAINRSEVAARNYDMFEKEKVLPDSGYAWVLHAGYVIPNYSCLAVPTRDQRNIIDSFPIPLIDLEPTQVEQIKEEVTLKLLSTHETGKQQAG